jgi:hypothetical protein
MNNLLRTIGRALLLEDEAFARIRDARDNFARGLVIVVTVSLIVGLFNALAGFVVAMRTSPEEKIALMQEDIRQTIEQMQALGVLGADPAFEQMIQTIESSLAIAASMADIVEETTPLPPLAVNLLQALGEWLSYPFGWIATWMLYGVVVLVFARLLGGTASVQEMLATTSLVAVPHLLDAFGFVPILGFFLSLAAFVWGVAVYVKGTAIANRLDTGRALVAVLAPWLLLFALAILGTIAVAVLLIVMGG